MDVAIEFEDIIIRNAPDVESAKEMMKHKYAEHRIRIKRAYEIPNKQQRGNEYEEL